MSSNVLQPNPPHILTLFHKKKKKKNYVANNTLLQPPKKSPSSSLSLKRTLFFTELCGLFWVSLSRSEFSQRKQGKQEPSHLFPYFYIFLFLICLSCFFLSYLSSSPSLFLSLFQSFILYHLSLSLPLSFYYYPSSLCVSLPLSVFSLFSFFLVPSFWVDLMKKMKMKMKGVVAKESSPYVVGEDPRTRLRHQSLLLDFEELQKETEAMKNKLQMMKQKKLTLSTEVRFLRKRYKYLITNQSPKPQPKQDFVHPQKFDTRNNFATKGKKYSKKEAALRHPVLVSDLNRKERIYNGGEATLRKPASIFDLNQKVRAFNGKEAALPTSAPKFDLNQKERIYSGKDAAKRNSTPVFDLNQISTEEEEIQADCEPLRTEESKKSLLRGGSDEQLNDMKISICRNVGSGSNRAGKRKISWQDQVALRV